jgi:RND family efflux transporter MFP subunit
MEDQAMTGKLSLFLAILGSVGLAVAAAALLTGCNSRSRAGLQSAAKDGGDQPVRVETIKPTREDLKRVSEATPAELLPYESTDIAAKIAGYVQKVHVDYGDRVKGPRYDSQGRLMAEGQLLVELRAPELVEELKQKEEMIHQAEADVKQATANEKAAAANLKTAEAAVEEAQAGRVRADAEEAFARSQYQRLSKTGQAVERQVIEEALYRKNAAEAARAEIEAKVESMRAARDESAAKRDKAASAVLAAQARMGVAGANRDQAKAVLQYTTLTAPYEGVVTRRNIHTGAYLTGKGGEQPLLNIARTDKLRVAVDIPEKDVRFLKPDRVVEVGLDALPGQKFTWKITRFAPVLGAGKKVRVEAHVDNPDGNLYPGMYGHAVVVLEHKNGALTVPSTCLSTDDKGSFVYTVADGKAQKRHVTLGINDGKNAEIVSGLTGAEEVISSGKDAVHDGQPVAARTTAAGRSK